MVTIEEIVIEAEKWEDEIDNEKCEVKLESAQEIKVEESEQKKATELSKELSEERSINGSVIVVKSKGIKLEREHENSNEMSAKSSELILSENASAYDFTNNLNFVLFNVSIFV